MSKTFLVILPLLALLIACETSERTETPGKQQIENEDELIQRYSSLLIANPRSQQEKDENTILKFLIDSLWDCSRTPSGIYYHIESPGTGSPPNLQSRVIVHYRGTTPDGREFDSSYKKGVPAMFSLNAVIPGWQEALQMLRPGGKGTFIIPSGLAYGKEGFPGLIEPNTVLIFYVELLKFS
jgi:FKBP-type peptidyl-prolyl cis-trans isomerase FkpA